MSSEIPSDVQFKVLLVDDDANVIKSLRRLLMEIDRYEIFTAASGAEALSFLEQEADVAVIISDQMMPEMTGVEFLSRVRATHPDTVRILLTGYAEVESSIAAINRGAVYRYLTKPWEDERVLQVVGEASREYWLKAENKRLNALVAKQNAELQDWNARLKQRVMEQTAQIRAKSDALAVSNRNLRENFTETIEAFAALIQMRDRKASGHSQNVAALVRAMAEQLNLPKEDQDNYYSAALLHDIGKIGMSDRLINVSVENLTGEDLTEYQKHVVRGQSAIETIPALRDIGILVRYHHERYDGRGFPENLKGKDIPLGSRLIHAADLLERQLRRSHTENGLEEASKRLNSCWGALLDPELRAPLEEGANEVYSHLDITPEAVIVNLSPKQLKVGMQLRHDLYSGTGVLMLKEGTIFDEKAIEAVNRCLKVDPFEKKVSVIIRPESSREA